MARDEKLNKLLEEMYKQTGRATAQAAQRSAKLAEDALLIGERPYIFVNGMGFKQPSDPATFDYTGPEVWADAIYQLANHGRTPATVTPMSLWPLRPSPRFRSTGKIEFTAQCERYTEGTKPKRLVSLLRRQLMADKTPADVPAMSLEELAKRMFAMPVKTREEMTKKKTKPRKRKA